MNAGRYHLGSFGLLGLLGLIRLDRLGGGVSVKERLVVLLGFDKGILEGVGVWEMSAASHEFFGSGERTLRVGKADSKSHGLGLALANIGGSVPHPASVRSDVGGQLHLGDDCKKGRQLLPAHDPVGSSPRWAVYAL